MTTKSNSYSSYSDKRKYFINYLPTTDDVLIIVLKGHLIIEEILNEILKSNCKNYSSICDAKLTFYQKANVVKALMYDLNEICFPAIFLLNELRNDLAHNLDSKKRDKRIELFIDKSKSLFSELHNDNSTMPGKLRNAICHAITSLSLVADLSIILKEQPNK